MALLHDTSSLCASFLSCVSVVGAMGGGIVHLWFAVSPLCPCRVHYFSIVCLCVLRVSLPQLACHNCVFACVICCMRDAKLCCSSARAAAGVVLCVTSRWAMCNVGSPAPSSESQLFSVCVPSRFCDWHTNCRSLDDSVRLCHTASLLVLLPGGHWLACVFDRNALSTGDVKHSAESMHAWRAAVLLCVTLRIALALCGD